MPRAADPKTYLWCDACRRSYAHADAPGRRCPVDGTPLREMGRLAAIARGIIANELSSPDLRTKHRQLLRLIWTRNGMGERYYRVLGPEIPYPKFEARVTDLLLRGAAEGWVRFVLPPAPTADESAYRLEFDSDERFVEELERLFAGDVGAEAAGR